MSKTALVFGASGVSGWSFINEILHDYPQTGTWKRAHALTNRPLSLEQSLWPDDARLNIVSGIDLLAGSQEDFENTLASRIPDIGEVTHVYYVAYKAGVEVQTEMDQAMEMWRKAVIAVDRLCPSLEFVVLQLGSKIYGCHLLATLPWYEEAEKKAHVKPTKLLDYLHVPHAESQPRIRPPYDDMLFYHRQIDFIASYAADKKWRWCETRPDIVVGFVPNQNFYSLATCVGVYLSLWREVHGKGADCPFPGTAKSWKALSNDSSSDMIARQTIHLSLSPGTEKGGGYNVADEREPSSWSRRWPILCAEFGLRSTGPTDNPPEIRTFIKENMHVWHRLEDERGLQKGHADHDKTIPGFEYFMFTKFDFDRQYDMTKMYSTGFTEERRTRESWGGVFERMRRARILP